MHIGAVTAVNISLTNGQA